MKKCTNNRTMSFRRLLALLLGLVLFMELLPGGLTVVGDASDAVTVTVDGAKTAQVTLPQSGRVTMEAASETGDTDYQWQIQLDGDWVSIYDATAATLTLTYAMVSPALEKGSAMVRCAVGGESVSDPVKVTVSYEGGSGAGDVRGGCAQAHAAPVASQRRSGVYQRHRQLSGRCDQPAHLHRLLRNDQKRQAVQPEGAVPHLSGLCALLGSR